MGESIYCPLCGKVVGECCHQRASMILSLLDALDKLKERLNEKN